MTFWRGWLIVASLLVASLAYWHPGYDSTLPRISPAGSLVTIQQPIIEPPKMATEQVCKQWGYPEYLPVETIRVCVERPVPSPF